jgi:flagellar hook-associated protein 1
MLGLFSTLNLGARSLQAQQTAVEVAGQNLANVNNPAYARQRVQIQTSPAIHTSVGPQGTGAQAVAIQQLRDQLVDNQIRNEESVGGYWTAKQNALQNAQASLGEFIDRNADALNGVSNGGGVSSGLADDISVLFNSFQSVATSPTSLTERQALLDKAATLAMRLNQTSQRLGELGDSMDKTLSEDAASANQLIADIANLNDSIMTSELGQTGMANDLRDRRQEKLEALGQLVNYEAVENANGTVDISVGGVTMLSVNVVQDTLETFDAGGGQMLVRAATSGTPLTISSGALQGTIDARDDALRDLRTGLDTLASSLITDVNAIHRAGFGLQGTTGEDFFTGTNAGDIGINATLKENPALIQAAGVSGEVANNTVALALAQLARDSRSTLNGQTFSGAYGSLVADLGHELNTTNGQLSEHEAVAAMLERQRASVSGVSLDEEMSDLVRFQHAYEASARIISTVDQMIQTVLAMKQ